MVWPGDVNKDGLVDSFDLLAIGVFHDFTSTARVGASTSYFGQFANDWFGNQINDANIKHGDVDGSGEISANDANVLLSNYCIVYSPVDENVVGEIPLIVKSPDETNPGDTVEFIDSL